jgi:lipoprotein-anchoring transpeptidase ErfK/SrfK
MRGGSGDAALWMLGMTLAWGAGCRQATRREAAPPPMVPAAGVPPAAPRPETTPGVAPKPARPVAPAPPPKEIVIAWEASLLYLLENGKPIGKPLVINGAQRRYFREAHLGRFVITEKARVWRSNLYDVNGDPLPDRRLAATRGAVMRNWMRLGTGAVGLHYSPAFRFHVKASERHRSHGCYRLSKEDSERVYQWAPKGTPVHVVRSLAGTRWAFLRQHTPPELLPGYVPPTRP